MSAGDGEGNKAFALLAALLFLLAPAVCILCKIERGVHLIHGSYIRAYIFEILRQSK